MEIQQQPNRWSCLPTTFAMVIAIPVNVFIEAIGHDGSEITQPAEPEPRNRKSFTLEEMFYHAFHFGYACSLYPRETMYLNDSQDMDMIQLLAKISNPTVDIIDLKAQAARIQAEVQIRDNSEYIDEMMRRFNGVALVDDPTPHAVAWNADEKAFYDPIGLVYPQTAFAGKILWYIPLINIGHFSGGGPGKYGYISSSKKSFHPGEPLFLGRATDKLIPWLMQIYMNMAGSHGITSMNGLDKKISDMLYWQHKHPSLVKLPD